MEQGQEQIYQGSCISGAIKYQVKKPDGKDGQLGANM